VRLVSRKGVDHTARFPDLVNAITALPGPTLVLDGEVAVFDEKLVSRFEFLAEPHPKVATTPPVYIAFDVLYARGRDLRARREVLERIVDGSPSVLPVRRLVIHGASSLGRGAGTWSRRLRREGSDLDISRRWPDARMAQSEGATRGALRGRRPGRAK
jgi:hypothetical protein